MTCSICSHEHIRFINYFLDELPQKLKYIAMFYELDIHALKYHLDNCMKDMDPGDYGT